MAARFRQHRRVAGFTLVELVTVLVIMGILAAVGISRFFDKRAFDAREYADQAKSIIRYGQKLAIAQNRNIFIRSDGNSFAVCSLSSCAAGSLVAAPGGNNSGSTAAKAYCQVGGYVSSWMCEGLPTGVTVAAESVRPEFGAGGFFYFDALGRPYNKADVGSTTSSFTAMTLTFTGGGAFKVTVEPETGYVH